MRNLLASAGAVLAAALVLACDPLRALSNGSPPPPPSPAESAVGPRPRPSHGSVIGNEGIAAWAGLPETEKQRVNSFRSLFLHQSVGGDLEDGAKENGYKFNYYEVGSTIASELGPHGGLTKSPNGEGEAKLAEFQDSVLKNKTKVRVAIFKFGYGDVTAVSLAKLQPAYQRTVAAIKAAGVHVLHVTPPLVFDTADNEAKLQMRTWMQSTFKGDVIFDLDDIESTDPSAKRCEIAGVWRVCPEYRVTASCRSQQNTEADQTTQGHLCLRTAATKIARSFLYAIYEAGK